MKKYIKESLGPSIDKIFEKKADNLIDNIRNEMESFIYS